MFAMNATANMANTIAVITMVQAVLDVDAESCNERIGYGQKLLNLNAFACKGFSLC